MKNKKQPSTTRLSPILKPLSILGLVILLWACKDDISPEIFNDNSETLKNYKSQAAQGYNYDNVVPDIITVRVDASVPMNWTTPIQNAITELNAVNAWRLQFVTTTSSNAYLEIVGLGAGNSNEIANTTFRLGGLPKITINTDYVVGTHSNYGGTSTELKWATVHEMGHAIRLEHTDDPQGRSRIPGTDDTDSGSVMNTLSIQTFSGITDNDLRAYHYLYNPITEDKFYSGDWDGDGTYTMASKRGNQFLFDYDQDGIIDATHTFTAANGTEEFFVGDWDNNGYSSLAYRVGDHFYLDYDLDGDIDKDYKFGSGNSQDQYLAGDWNGSGKHTFAYRTGNTIYKDNAGDGGAYDAQVTYGPGGSTEYYAGDWNGNGTFGLAYRQGTAFTLDNGTSDWLRVVTFPDQPVDYFVGNFNGQNGFTMAAQTNKFINDGFHFQHTRMILFIDEDANFFPDFTTYYYKRQ